MSYKYSRADKLHENRCDATSISFKVRKLRKRSQERANKVAHKPAPSRFVHLESPARPRTKAHTSRRTPNGKDTRSRGLSQRCCGGASDVTRRGTRFLSRYRSQQGPELRHHPGPPSFFHSPLYTASFAKLDINAFSRDQRSEFEKRSVCSRKRRRRDPSRSEIKGEKGREGEGQPG